MCSRLSPFSWIAVFVLAACSPGTGRPPEFPDAAERPRDAALPDAFVRDATPLDAGARDGTIVLPDATPLPMSPFTGVFGILNAADPLYAREVGGRLNLVVGRFPYDYIGTISADGAVDTTSNELARAGCAVARITGSYDRGSATFQLLHETCNEQGAPLSSRIGGGFSDDFDPARSGIYALEATVMSNPDGCFEGPLTGHRVRYGFNFLRSFAMAVFTADDVISTPAWYQGQASTTDYAFTAIERLDATPAPLEVSMSGRFEQATANDPVRFIGLRDVYDPSKSCGFTITLDGIRTDAP